jgi:NADPH:quinone reductase-like Zn-dependent oxidoreductase
MFAMHAMRKGLFVVAAGLLFTAAASAAPATSQAIVNTSGTLALQSVTTPKPAAGQVLIQVIAVGVNPVDWKRQAQIPGFDVAGVIDSVGPAVTAFKPGDVVGGGGGGGEGVVVARTTGAYAEYAIAPVEETIAKPKSLTFEQASGMPVAGVAGYRAAEEAKLAPGQRVAIIGAAGGSGEAAVQVAKTHGAKVIAIGHSSQAAFLKSLGVDEFVAFDKEDVAAKVKGVDAALNLVDGQAVSALSYVKRGGHFTSIAGSPGDDKIAAAGVTSVVIAGGTYRGISNGDALRGLAALADKGQYKVTVSRTFPLAEAGKAQELGKTGQTIGKIVLVVDPARSKQK